MRSLLATEPGEPSKPIPTRSVRPPYLVIGPYDGASRPGFEGMVTRFQSAGLDVQPTSDINRAIWKKRIATVTTNVVAALTGLTGNTALQHEPSVKNIEALSLELARVARAKGIDLTELEDPVDFSLKAFAPTKDNRVSMLQDVEAGRPSEIGNLNEVIVSEGRRFNIPTPYNEAVAWLIRGVEERNRQKLAVVDSGSEPDAVRGAIKCEDLEALRRSLEASPLARSPSIRFTEFENRCKAFFQANDSSRKFKFYFPWYNGDLSQQVLICCCKSDAIAIGSMGACHTGYYSSNDGLQQGIAESENN